MSFGFGMGFTRNDPFAGGPSLNLQFAGNTVLDPSITFTRALNTATYFNSAGLLTTANANVARFDYDPSTLASRGLLIEEARTNTLLQSRDMTQAAWTKTDVTPNRNQVGLDGVANTATLLTEGSAGTAITQQSGTAVTAGSTITGSAVLKRGNTDWVRITVRDTTLTDGANAWFNLATGAKGSVTAVGAGTSNSSTITSLGGGWYRCTVTTLPNGTYTIPAIGFISASADNSGTRVSGATYIVDCAQLELGAFATSVIPTTTTTLTRNADSAVMTGANFSSWYNSTNGTIFFEYGPSPTLTAERRWLSINDTTTANRFVFNKGASATSDGAFVTAGGVGQTAAFSSVNTSSASVIRIAFSYEAAGTSMSSQGSVAATAGAITLPTVTQMNIGTDRGVFPANSWIRRITYYPRRLSNAELQSITS